jgi:acetoin utilization protein AcuC
MGCSLHVAWAEAMVGYDFGPGHPLAPVRLDLTMRLARELGVLDRPDVTLVAPDPVDDSLLELVHVPEYVAAVRAASEDQRRTDPQHGLGTPDNPVFAGMHDASALIAGATVAAARAVWSGEQAHGISIAGGLHHAMPDHASGFCVYNDPAIAIAWLLDQGAERVAYVDVDVHHGDGVQEVFWDDPRVLTISLHETGTALFPGTGFPTDIGGPEAEGYAVNVALPPGTGDGGWLRAFHAIVPPLLEAFDPVVLVSQQGCDTHAEDPLAHLALSVDGQRASYLALHDLAHTFAGGRWLATGGGGYALVDVVPRAWTHLLAIASGRPLDPATEVPHDWRDHVRSRFGRGGPARLTDGSPATFRPYDETSASGDAVDEAIAETRSAVFPRHRIETA